MSALPIIAIFDIGKTNKKLFLFNENYEIVFEMSARFTETTDEDGFPCENLESLTHSVFDSLKEIFNIKKFKVTAVNFSTYGASLVYVDKNGKPLTPLYNYLKPFPEELSERFYATYGGKEEFSIQTASPVLDSLNSGLQLYRLKYEKPIIFKNLHYALHLPQYLSYLLTGKFYSDITSIGSPTALWNFKQNGYHDWINKEGLIKYLAPIENSNKTFTSGPSIYKCKVGIGLHDSSAALIPYLVNFTMPFVLISTGTWSISMNPFNKSPLTVEELKNDCLCYLQYLGEPVKASRLHAGLEYERQVKRLADHFNQDIIKYRDIIFDSKLVNKLKSNREGIIRLSDGFYFHKRNLSEFKTDIEAYHQLVIDIIGMQFLSTSLVIDGPAVKRIFVDGGFSNNSVFMNLLANAFPEMEVFAGSMAQATSVGAALAIHQEWNSKPIPNDIIRLKYYSSGKTVRF
jgi:sugar (pentulose or hexulose) kinase